MNTQDNEKGVIDYSLSEEEMKKINHIVENESLGNFDKYINSLLKERSTRFYEKGFDEGADSMEECVEGYVPPTKERKKRITK